MTTSLIPKSDVLFTESPISWNTRYINPEGFECQFTLRGETGQEVLEKANAAIAFLLNTGCTPVVKAHPANGNTVTSSIPENGNGNGNHQDAPSNGNSSWCPIHNVEMKRWEKNGRTWYSHKVGSEWCTGKSKRK